MLSFSDILYILAVSSLNFYLGQAMLYAIRLVFLAVSSRSRRQYHGKGHRLSSSKLSIQTSCFYYNDTRSNITSVFKIMLLNDRSVDNLKSAFFKGGTQGLLMNRDGTGRIHCDRMLFRIN